MAYIMSDRTNQYRTKEEALKAVKWRGDELDYCTPEMKDDEDVIMAAMSLNSYLFRKASERIKANKAFIIKAVKASGYVFPFAEYAHISIQSDIEVMTLVLEKSSNAEEFAFAKGEAALSKELAAKALAKYGQSRFGNNLGLWEKIHPTLQEFFPQDSWLEKAKAYLLNLEKIKQEAENASGGSSTQDEVIW